MLRRNTIDTGDRPVFQKVLGSTWQDLPANIRDLHDVDGIRRYAGRASVATGHSFIGRLVGRVFGFPAEAQDIPVKVTMKCSAGRERWSRDFAGHEFSSVITAGRGRFSNLVCERFGPFNFSMALILDDGRLCYVPRGWTFFGMPMPRILAPQGNTYEYVEDGKFQFHAEITLPLIGHIVTYQGWLADVPIATCVPFRKSRRVTLFFNRAPTAGLTSL